MTKKPITLLIFLVILATSCTSPTITSQPASSTPNRTLTNAQQPSAVNIRPSTTSNQQSTITPSPQSAIISPQSTITIAPSPTEQSAITAIPQQRTQPSAINPPPQNIILIIVDSVRSDHLSSYGYSRQTTPNLDRLMGDLGARFERVISTASWTCPSVAAMFTGRTPTSLGTTFKTMEQSIPKRAKTLAEYLKKAGYYTAGFPTTYCVRDTWGFSKGFDYYDKSPIRAGSDKTTAAMVNDRVIGWLENKWLPRQKSERQPLFLMLYYFDPHVWWDPPAPYDTLYDPDYTGPLTPEVFAHGEKVVSGEIAPTPRDVQHLIAMYDGEIAYWDEQLARILEYFQQQGYLDNSLVVVTADHGEQFGEHGKWMHANSLYEESTRVPLFMRYTGVIPSNVVIKEPIQNYDLMPTILDWAGIPLPKDLQAISVKNQALGTPGDPARLLFSEVDGLLDTKHSLYWATARVSMRAVEQNDWKFIHYLSNPDLDELYHLNPTSLYETENFIQSEPARAQELLQQLFRWFGIDE